ncbi:MAG TPA: phospholipase D-like domain-containing protein, partial [Candidatus Thermoplasmatota archaeon]|nr:phospholipase D-like domain-containing protein [Candidatus Thermoplasmatota archaeon]
MPPAFDAAGTKPVAPAALQGVVRAASVGVLTLLVAATLASAVQGAAERGPQASLQVALVEAPSWVALAVADLETPLPVALRLGLLGPPGASVSLRAGFGVDGAWASRTWTAPLPAPPAGGWPNGEWQRSDWRIPAPVVLNSSGYWEGYLAVVPNLDATHAARVFAGASASLVVTARLGSQPWVTAVADVPLVRESSRGSLIAPGPLVEVATAEGRVSLPVLPTATGGLIHVPLPSLDAQVSIADTRVSLTEGDGLVLRPLVTGGWLIKNVGPAPHELGGLCLRGSRAFGCFQNGSLLPGAGLGFGTATADPSGLTWFRPLKRGESLTLLDGQGLPVVALPLPLPPPFTSAGATAYVTPGGSLDIVLRFLGDATWSVDLAGYTFDSAPLAVALAEAAARGVRVRVLVDGSPVGGQSEAEARALTYLAAKGVAVHTMPAKGSPFPAFHPKYAVRD